MAEAANALAALTHHRSDRNSHAVSKAMSHDERTAFIATVPDPLAKFYRLAMIVGAAGGDVS